MTRRHHLDAAERVIAQRRLERAQEYRESSPPHTSPLTISMDQINSAKYAHALGIARPRNHGMPAGEHLMLQRDSQHRCRYPGGDDEGDHVPLSRRRVQ